MDIPPGMLNYCALLASITLWRYLEFANTPCTEIRLLIYPYLLVSDRCANFSNPMHDWYPCAPIVSIHDSSIRHRKLRPSALSLRPIKYDGRSIWDATLYPEILATCKTLNREGRDFLCFYRESVFRFNLLDISPFSRLHYHLDTDIWRSAPEVFDWKKYAVWLGGKVPEALRSNVFAAFLAKIGRGNAARITQLSFDFGNLDELALSLPLITS